MSLYDCDKCESERRRYCNCSCPHGFYEKESCLTCLRSELAEAKAWRIEASDTIVELTKHIKELEQKAQMWRVTAEDNHKEIQVLKATIQNYKESSILSNILIKNREQHIEELKEEIDGFKLAFRCTHQPKESDYE